MAKARPTAESSENSWWWTMGCGVETESTRAMTLTSFFPSRFSSDIGLEECGEDGQVQESQYRVEIAIGKSLPQASEPSVGSFIFTPHPTAGHPGGAARSSQSPPR